MLCSPKRTVHRGMSFTFSNFFDNNEAAIGRTVNEENFPPLNILSGELGEAKRDCFSHTVGLLVLQSHFQHIEFPRPVQGAMN